MLYPTLTAGKEYIMAVEDVKDNFQANVEKRTYSVQEVAEILQSTLQALSIFKEM